MPSTRLCLPLYEGVDWNTYNRFIITVSRSLLLYEGVDWNKFCHNLIISVQQCLPLYEGVDWNNYILTLQSNDFCLPLYEGVDWNCQNGVFDCYKAASPSLRGSGLKLVYACLYVSSRRSPSLRGSGLKSQRNTLPCRNSWMSPSLRGSGLKYFFDNFGHKGNMVSLFTREWIEIGQYARLSEHRRCVSLFTREWIEILFQYGTFA